MRWSAFPGGVLVWLETGRLQLSDRQVRVLEIVEAAWRKSCISPREDLYEELWGLPQWHRRRRPQVRATQSQRASLARTLRRLESHGLVERSGIREPFAWVKITAVGRHLLDELAAVGARQTVAGEEQNAATRVRQ